MNFAFFRSFRGILALLLLGIASGFAAETGTITASAVNVRGRAGFIGEVITKLNQGDTVTILEAITLTSPKAGEPAEWLRVALPANTPVWVHASYVDPATQTVTASRLKVRGGPSIDHPVLGIVDRGVKVSELRRQGEWMEIEPVEGLHAFVAAEMVRRTVETPAPPVNTAVAAPGESTPITTSTPTAPDPAVTTTDPARVEPDPNTNRALPVGADIGEPVTTSTPAPATPPSTTIVADPAPAIATPPATTDRELTADERARQVLEQRTRNSQHWEVTGELDEQLLKELPAKRRVVVREGKIRRALSIQAPGDYTLEHIGTGLRLNYLYTTSTNLPLRELVGVKVRIQGEEGIDERWPGTPVLLIRSLEVLP